MTRLSRRTLIGTVAATALTAAAMTGAHAQDLPKLTVALAVMDANFNVTTGSAFRLAADMGYFERAGVDVEFVTLDGTPQAVAALRSGAVDLADISVDAAIRLRAENDVPVRGVVAVSMGSAFLIAAKSDIETVDQLAGRSFAIADNGSLDHQLTQAVVRSYDLSPDDMNFVAIGAPDVRVHALAAGRVDATTVSFGTYASIAGTDGVHVLVDADTFSTRAPALSKFVAGLEPTLAEKSDAITRFTSALIDVSRDMEANPQTWIDAAAAARDDLSRDSIAATAELLKTRWCVNGCMEPESLAGSIAFVYSGPDFANTPVLGVDDLTDLSFTQNALQALGTAGGDSLDARN
ncbi:ABC transporter substrate-binding protein [Ketogulonicigenium robustum]|uniref:ABC transporter substrate-binding protein n=1 Tax=Ketogulonicigenium robustum TaxID=92947 RepID=A0A1W6P099_9RHOB|nr:ABC transporter substrate-binding protein [Ketogulonicigenium robustum]ARO14869.1 ABC transporter substrate-binding protein [Ketogulonicigenium robustum]